MMWFECEMVEYLGSLGRLIPDEKVKMAASEKENRN